MTAHDAVVGTPYYMAPEQWEGGAELDARVDVFAAGVLLYYLLSGRFPYPGDSPMQVMYRLNKAPAEPLTIQRWGAINPRRRAHLEDRLRAIVDTAVQRRCQERYQLASQFREALEKWLNQAEKACDGRPPSLSSSRHQSIHNPSDSTPPGTPHDSLPTPSSSKSSDSTPTLDGFGDSPISSETHFSFGASFGAIIDEQGEEPMQSPQIDLSAEYVEIAENIYWVGKRPDNEIFYANPYLRKFPDSTRGDFNLLIDPGSSKDFAVVQSKVNQVIGDISNVHSIFINHQDPDVGSSTGLLLGRYAPDAYVLCTEDTWRLVHYYNIPRKQFVPMEKYPNGMQLPNGDVLIPVASPFCHFVGAMMLYDPSTRVLFSGDLFGGLTDRDASGLYADDSDWTGMRAFHQIYMPTNPALQNAIDNIRQLDPPVEVIAPQHGRVIRGKYVQEFMDRLYNLPVGLDILADRNATDDELRAWTTVLERVLDIAATAMGRHEVEELLEDDPNLSGHITFNEGRPMVETLGKTSVEQAVRILCDKAPAATANSIKYEVIFAAEEMGLPTPRVELDEDGEAPEANDSGPDLSLHFDAV